jgi:hypothetical protein
MTQPDEFEHELTQEKKNGLISMAIQFKENCKALFIYPDIAAARFATALNAISWSFMLLLTTDVVFNSVNYIGMNNIASRSVWSAMFAAMGSVQMFTLISRIQPSWYTFVLSFFSAMVWVFITISLMISNINNFTNIATTGVVAWLAIWIFARSRYGNEPDMRRRKTD